MNGSSKKALPKRNTITWSKPPEQPRKRTEASRVAMFHTLQLNGVAQEVEDTIVKIMKEAASA
jgi:hypothetical protein